MLLKPLRKESAFATILALVDGYRFEKYRTSTIYANQTKQTKTSERTLTGYERSNEKRILRKDDREVSKVQLQMLHSCDWRLLAGF